MARIESIVEAKSIDLASFGQPKAAEMVNARIEGAQASAKSLRWYAHDMRKKGAAVPERQRAERGEGEPCRA